MLLASMLVTTAPCLPTRAPANLAAADAVGAEAPPTVHPASAARMSCRGGFNRDECSDAAPSSPLDQSASRYSTFSSSRLGIWTWHGARDLLHTSWPARGAPCEPQRIPMPRTAPPRVLSTNPMGWPHRCWHGARRGGCNCNCDAGFNGTLTRLSDAGNPSWQPPHSPCARHPGGGDDECGGADFPRSGAVRPCLARSALSRPPSPSS
jgi:hypothetical protein